MSRPAIRPWSTLVVLTALCGPGRAASAQTTPPTPPATPPPAAASAPTSDAAATGFLKSVVDRRVYSLEGAGAARLTGTARASFEVTARNATLQPTVIDFSLRADYATGERGAQPTAAPTATQKPVVPFALATIENAFSFLPSRGANQWSVAFAQEDPKGAPGAKGGDAAAVVRLDYRPRQEAGAQIGSWSEWHAADGTPLRRRVSSFRPVKGAVEPIVQEIVPAYVEKKGKLLLSELKPGDPEGRFSWSFEYEEKDGFVLVKKIVQQNEGWRLTVEFALQVERTAPR